jgi:hypothetical protein
VSIEMQEGRERRVQLKREKQQGDDRMERRPSYGGSHDMDEEVTTTHRWKHRKCESMGIHE